MRKEKQNVSSEPLTEREKQLMKEIAELKEANEILDEHPDNHNYGIDRILLALNQKGEYPL